MLLGLLLTLNIIVCLALIGVVLLQRSEGGALGGGGSPTGLITTRGAGDLLTRTTWILFAAFLGLSLALTLLGGHQRSSDAILNRLKGESVNPDLLRARTPPPVPGQAPPPVGAPGSTAGPPGAAPRPAASPAPSAAPPLQAAPGGFLPPPRPVIGGSPPAGSPASRP
jgi:preprotein translocase subunit SecG